MLCGRIVLSSVHDPVGNMGASYMHIPGHCLAFLKDAEHGFLKDLWASSSDGLSTHAQLASRAKMNAKEAICVILSLPAGHGARIGSQCAAQR